VTTDRSALCCRSISVSVLVVVSTPRLAFSTRLVEAHEPMLISILFGPCH